MTFTEKVKVHDGKDELKKIMNEKAMVLAVEAGPPR